MVLSAVAPENTPPWKVVTPDGTVNEVSAVQSEKA